MGNKNSDMKTPNIDSNLSYYQNIWEKRCNNAGVDEDVKGFFNYAVNELKSADKNSNRQKVQWKKIELLTIVIAFFNAIFTALIIYQGIMGAVFNVLAIITSALMAAVVSYNAFKKPKETWLRHRANSLMIDVEILCFCNGVFEYEGKTDAEAIKIFQERVTKHKIQNCENFLSNMGCTNFKINTITDKSKTSNDATDQSNDNS